MAEHRDPVCGMTGTIEKHGHWFCSPACIAKYEAARQSGTVPEGTACAPEHPLWGQSLIRDPIVWAMGLVVLPLSLGTFWPAAQPVSQSLWFYLSKAGWAVALGLLLGGIIDHYVPKAYISLFLSGRRRRTILASAGLGFLASSCSHGCLALSMELYRKGASPAAVITFLLASPWASLPMTLLIISLMGVKGLAIVLVALVIAVASGLVFQSLEHRGLMGPNPNAVTVAPGFSIWRDLKGRFRRHRWTRKVVGEDLAGIGRGALSLGRMVLIWVALGFVFSAVLGAVVPEGWWTKFFGPSFLGLLATMGVATVIEVCSEGTAPMAVELFRQTAALGNAFGFLMGGVVTDFTELSLLWANLGRRVVGWFLAVTLPQVLLWGMLLNLIGS